MKVNFRFLRAIMAREEREREKEGSRMLVE